MSSSAPWLNGRPGDPPRRSGGGAVVTRPAVFLDRDGVIVEARIVAGVALPEVGPDAVVIPADVPAGVARLRHAGYALVVVTNQPDVARGTTSMEVVDAINERLGNELALDAVYVCVHDNTDGCSCRKPGPGMLLDAATDLDLDLGSSWLIGDRWVDIGAAASAGVRSVLLDRPYSWAADELGGAASRARTDREGREVRRGRRHDPGSRVTEISNRRPARVLRQVSSRSRPKAS